MLRIAVFVVFVLCYLAQLWIGVAVSPWSSDNTITREEHPGQFWFLMAIEGLGVIVLPVVVFLSM